MADRRRIDVRFATQLLLLQLAVVALTMGIAFALLAFVGHRRLITESGYARYRKILSGPNLCRRQVRPAPPPSPHVWPAPTPGSWRGRRRCRRR